MAKEPLVAIVYVLGVMLPAFSISSDDQLPFAISMGGLLLGLAIANLILFAAFEIKIDEKEGHPSIAKFLGKERALLWAKIFASTTLAGSILMALQSLETALMFGVMALTLLLVCFFPGYSEKHERYRILGDGIFLVPLISMLY